jgi:hypothetical protein
MPCVEFEPTIPASERAKTVHALDRSATVTGCVVLYTKFNLISWYFGDATRVHAREKER